MIDSMKANLFGVMVHPIMPQCIVTGSQENQMIRTARIVLSCSEQAGMTQSAERSLAIFAKNPMVIFGTIYYSWCGILDLINNNNNDNNNNNNNNNNNHHHHHHNNKLPMLRGGPITFSGF